MSESKFDELIHAPNRLQICALLDNVDELEFKVLREHLKVSDSVMSKHIKSLDEAGYITSSKRADFGRKRTWLKLSTMGHKAYRNHVTELRKIVG